DFFFATGARPLAWNQWAEVVGRDPREPRFIGDMPHAWVASDFVRSALDLFAYERPEDQAVVLAAGVPLHWLDGPGIAIKHLRTRYGELSYSLKREGRRIELHITPGTVPPGGFAITLPPGRVQINGKPSQSANGEIRVIPGSEPLDIIDISE